MPGRAVFDNAAEKVFAAFKDFLVKVDYESKERQYDTETGTSKPKYTREIIGFYMDFTFFNVGSALDATTNDRKFVVRTSDFDFEFEVGAILIDGKKRFSVVSVSDEGTQNILTALRIRGLA